MEMEMEAVDPKHIYQVESDKTCFQRDIAYRDFKYFPRRTASDEVLRDTASNFAQNPKFYGYQGGLEGYQGGLSR